MFDVFDKEENYSKMTIARWINNGRTFTRLIEIAEECYAKAEANGAKPQPRPTVSATPPKPPHPQPTAAKPTPQSPKP
jgi:hypothetical protein